MAAPKRNRRSLPSWAWALLASPGLFLLAWGLLRSRDPAPLPPPSGSPTSALGMVQPGTVSIDLPPVAEASAPEPSARCPGCDVVLITVCSLRRDAVSALGGPAGQTPAIDSIARGGYRFRRAYAASNFTLASLTAVLTGRFGSSTGVLGWDKGLQVDVPTLPEVLGYYGYRTAAFTIDAPSGFRPDYGLHRGFQRMEVYAAPRDTPDGRMRGGEPGPGGRSADPVVDYLAEAPTDRPLFLMFHSRSAHFPFVITPDPDRADPTGIHQLLWEAGMSAPKAGVAMPGMAGGTAQQGVVEIGSDPLLARVQEQGPPAVQAWRDLYNASVSRMDIDVARVLEALERRGRLDRTILLLVADHGESLYDHGELLHGDAYWDGVINVPMVMKVPGLAGQEAPMDALVSHPDILPTLLELVGAVVPAGVDGQSMLPLLTGEADQVREIALSEGGVARQIGPHPRGAVIAPPWIMLRQERGCGGPHTLDPPRENGSPATCLYQMEEDPLQERSVALQHPEVTQELLQRWAAFRLSAAARSPTLTLDPRLIEELRRTGYDFRSPSP